MFVVKEIELLIIFYISITFFEFIMDLIQEINHMCNINLKY